MAALKDIGGGTKVFYAAEVTRLVAAAESRGIDAEAAKHLAVEQGYELARSSARTWTALDALPGAPSTMDAAALALLQHPAQGAEAVRGGAVLAWLRANSASPELQQKSRDCRMIAERGGSGALAVHSQAWALGRKDLVLGAAWLRTPGEIAPAVRERGGDPRRPRARGSRRDARRVAAAAGVDPRGGRGGPRGARRAHGAEAPRVVARRAARRGRSGRGRSRDARARGALAARAPRRAHGALRVGRPARVARIVAAGAARRAVGRSAAARERGPREGRRHAAAVDGRLRPRAGGHAHRDRRRGRAHLAHVDVRSSGSPRRSPRCGTRSRPRSERASSSRGCLWSRRRSSSRSSPARRRTKTESSTRCSGRSGTRGWCSSGAPTTCPWRRCKTSCAPISARGSSSSRRPREATSSTGYIGFTGPPWCSPRSTRRARCSCATWSAWLRAEVGRLPAGHLALKLAMLCGMRSLPLDPCAPGDAATARGYVGVTMAPPGARRAWEPLRDHAASGSAVLWLALAGAAAPQLARSMLQNAFLAKRARGRPRRSTCRRCSLRSRAPSAIRSPTPALEAELNGTPAAPSRGPATRELPAVKAPATGGGWRGRLVLRHASCRRRARGRGLHAVVSARRRRAAAARGPAGGRGLGAAPRARRGRSDASGRRVGP